MRLPPKEAAAILDDRVLFDSWLFRAGDCWAWWVTGQEIVQGAPARVARGMALPFVSADGEPPFVAASRHPNGAIAVATLSRTDPQKSIFVPLADVTIAGNDGCSPIGIFGRYHSLTLNLTAPLGSRRVWAQDLAGDDGADITDSVYRSDQRMVLSGDLIDRVGRSAATPGDLSEPGLVLALKEM